MDDLFSSNSASIATGQERKTAQAPAGIVAPFSPNHIGIAQKSVPETLLSQSHKGVTTLTREKPELTEKDFPPLGPVRGQRKAETSSCWGDGMTAGDGGESNDGFVLVCYSTNLLVTNLIFI